MKQSCQTVECDPHVGLRLNLFKLDQSSTLGLGPVLAVRDCLSHFWHTTQHQTCTTPHIKLKTGERKPDRTEATQAPFKSDFQQQYALAVDAWVGFTRTGYSQFNVVSVEDTRT